VLLALASTLGIGLLLLSLLHRHYLSFAGLIVLSIVFAVAVGPAIARLHGALRMKHLERCLEPESAAAGPRAHLPPNLLALFDDTSALRTCIMHREQLGRDESRLVWEWCGAFELLELPDRCYLERAGFPRSRGAALVDAAGSVHSDPARFLYHLGALESAMAAPPRGFYRS
jgi:hypothetical protein